MDKQFWYDRWEKEEIAFHEDTVNPRLTKYIQRISPMGGHVFVPLCGKTLDIGWLLENGYKVTGVELSRTAIDSLFEQLRLSPKVRDMGKFVVHSAAGITIYEGDFFDLKQIHLLEIDCVYDRASLVALPQGLRKQYVTLLPQITSHAPQLLITLHYDITQMDGPPFAITSEDIRTYYQQLFTLTRVETVNMPNKLKGKCEATSTTWLLTKKDVE
ncbi:thiopurine S-methyltransferase [Alteromonas sp. ASW11-130]|uniref:thiopurine S-methyltransferase n=1 Tax=Alteromonas sp. ASW11-130 TaxID=3015775 RepID=UPI0022428DC1|nr:thiopurine S-methyltransferase [Alteromonas sp. ASW11-130]MCW8092206.1 thiopurine S-methyltransferase [Alteromonas sp. ASW11-130]